MRHPFLFWATALAVPALHFLLHVGFGMGGWAPDLLTVGLLVLVRELRPAPAAGLGFMMGLLEDAFSVLSFGANAMALTVVGLIGSRTRDYFVGETLLFLVLYLGLGSWLRIALHWVASGGLGEEGGFRVLAVHAPLASLYATAIGIFLLLATGAWRREGQGSRRGML